MQGKARIYLTSGEVAKRGEATVEQARYAARMIGVTPDVRVGSGPRPFYGFSAESATRIVEELVRRREARQSRTIKVATADWQI